MSRHHSLLERVVSKQVVPRLLLANTDRSIAAGDVPINGRPVNAIVGEFAELVIDSDADSAIRYFEGLIADGHTVESLFQNVLGPVACRLGELWEEDINDFLDVTRGVTHLQQIVLRFSDLLIEEGRRPASTRRALLTTLSHEMHTFGLTLVCETFRQHGWHVWSGPPHSQAEIMELLRTHWFDLFGLSVSQTPDCEGFASFVEAARRASRNKDVKVIAGGQIFNSQPELIGRLGTDAFAADAVDAISKVTPLLNPLTGPVN